MVPTQWGTENGISEELEAAVAAGRRAIADADDEDLKADYLAALGVIEERIDAERRQHEADLDAEW